MTDINNIMNDLETALAEAALQVRNAESEVSELRTELDSTAEAVELAEAWNDEFGGECVCDVAYELGQWRNNFPYDDADDIQRRLETWEEVGEDPDDVLAELEDYRALGTPEELQADSDKQEVEELRAEVERQARLIARLATALDEIDTITTDELAGTGGAS